VLRDEKDNARRESFGDEKALETKKILWDGRATIFHSEKHSSGITQNTQVKGVKP
jgi:hypothetical protein